MSTRKCRDTGCEGVTIYILLSEGGIHVVLCTWGLKIGKLFV